MWYRTMEADWHNTPQLKGDGGKLKVPVGLVCGTKDPVLKFFGGEAKVRVDLPKKCAVCEPPITFIKGAGHWTQQEKPDEVNAAILDFLAKFFPVNGHEAD